MQPSYPIVESKINEIEAEMKRIGMWRTTPPNADQLNITQAFGGNSLSLEQWLQFVFIPRVRHIIASHGEFPKSSQVHDRAFREWCMWGNEDNVDNLLELLEAFDALFG